ncbi:MAG: hypothetical protein AAGJ70_06330, partial [Pseudomonadota bacterium]
MMRFMLTSEPRPVRSRVRVGLVVPTLLTAFALGGCAGGADKTLAGLTGGAAKPTSKTFTPIDKSAAPVDRAIQYWSQLFAKNPGDEKAAVAYARNLRAKGEKQKALQVLQRATIALLDEFAIVARCS